jgi:hypothetical protein
VNASSRGHYTDLDWYPPATSGAVFAGFCYSCAQATFRSFYVFAIPNFTGTVSSVTFRLEHAQFSSINSSESFGFYDVSTNLTTLANGTADWLSAFTDLGAGTSYGTFTVSGATVGVVSAVQLNASASTKVTNSRGAQMGIGVRGTSYSGQTAEDEWSKFALDTEPRTNQLQIVVVP